MIDVHILLFEWEENCMALQKSLENVQADIHRGDLGKARDRLHGLINSHPEALELRKRLGEVYWQLQMPEMAGRYWYLEENKDERMAAACRRFERQFGNDPAYMLFAIRFKGPLDPIQDTFAGKTLLKLHQQAKEKHRWYEDFRNRGSLKYRQYKLEHAKHKTRDTIILLTVVALILLVVFLLIIGAISVIRWII